MAQSGNLTGLESTSSIDKNYGQFWSLSLFLAQNGPLATVNDSCVLWIVIGPEWSSRSGEFPLINSSQFSVAASLTLQWICLELKLSLAEVQIFWPLIKLNL